MNNNGRPMLLQKLDNKGDMPGRMIFCRGCDGAALARGASRDITFRGDSIDIYCRDCAPSVLAAQRAGT